MDSKIETTAHPLTLDDIAVGQVFRSGSRKLNAEEIQDFARQYDPQVFHVDEEAAGATFFKGLAASGWHTAAITMSLLVSSIPIQGGLIGKGGEITWPKATRPGDTLHVETEVLEVRPSHSRPDWGTVTVRSVTKNQAGESVQTLVSRLLVPRRQAKQ
jgi:acyl dehydratase